MKMQLTIDTEFSYFVSMYSKQNMCVCVFVCLCVEVVNKVIE
jgi:hypothetical protein